MADGGQERRAQFDVGRFFRLALTAFSVMLIWHSQQTPPAVVSANAARVRYGRYQSQCPRVSAGRGARVARLLCCRHAAASPCGAQISSIGIPADRFGRTCGHGNTTARHRGGDHRSPRRRNTTQQFCGQMRLSQRALRNVSHQRAIK